MEVDVVFLMKIILLGVIHWALVPLALRTLIERPAVIGGRKVPWAVAIIFVTCLGSLIYLIFHPKMQQATKTQAETG